MNIIGYKYFLAGNCVTFRSRFDLFEARNRRKSSAKEMERNDTKALEHRDSVPIKFLIIYHKKIDRFPPRNELEPNVSPAPD